MRHRISMPIFVLTLCVYTVGVWATVPNAISYQGNLTDSLGNPFIGTVTITFSIFNVPELGIAMWSETHVDVEISDGYINLTLGTIEPFPDTLFVSPELWLELLVDGETFTPRMQLSSVPFGLRSGFADVAGMAEMAGHSEHASFTDTSEFAVMAGFVPHAEHATWSDTAVYSVVGAPDGDWIISGNDVYRDSGKVGIGTSSPSTTLDVVGSRIRLGDSTGTRSKELVFRVDGAEIDIQGDGADLFIKSNSGNTILQGFGGKVGIGTNSPGAPLHLSNSSSSFGMFRIARSDSGDHEASMAFIEGSDATGGEYWLQGVGLWGHVNDYVIGRSSTKLLITPWGNVGIGTASPQELLHVYGTDNPRMIVEAPTNATPELNLKRGTESWQLFMSSDDDLAFFKNGTKVTFTDYGYVGIGTSTPQELLHVYGTSNPRIVVGAPSDASPEIDLRRGTESYQLFMNSDNDLAFFNDGTRVTFTDTGNVGIGTSSPDERLHVEGTVKCAELKITGGSDIAEPFDVLKEDVVKPGMVMSIDPDNPGKLRIAEEEYDHCVAGIVSGAGGISPGMIMGQEGSVADGEYPIAMTGRVYCWADASENSIQPGDLLTTSDNPGYAMKASDFTKAQGATIGKAMTSLDEGTGLVLVLVALQ